MRAMEDGHGRPFSRPHRGNFSKLKGLFLNTTFLIQIVANQVFFQNFGQNRKWSKSEAIFDFGRNFEKKHFLNIDLIQKSFYFFELSIWKKGLEKGLGWPMRAMEDGHGRPFSSPPRGKFSKMKGAFLNTTFLIQIVANQVFFQNFGQNRKWSKSEAIFDFARNFKKKHFLNIDLIQNSFYFFELSTWEKGLEKGLRRPSLRVSGSKIPLLREILASLFHSFGKSWPPFSIPWKNPGLVFLASPSYSWKKSWPRFSIPCGNPGLPPIPEKILASPFHSLGKSWPPFSIPLENPGLHFPFLGKILVSVFLASPSYSWKKSWPRFSIPCGNPGLPPIPEKNPGLPFPFLLGNLGSSFHSSGLCALGLHSFRPCALSLHSSGPCALSLHSPGPCALGLHSFGPCALGLHSLGKFFAWPHAPPSPPV